MKGGCGTAEERSEVNGGCGTDGERSDVDWMWDCWNILCCVNFITSLNELQLSELLMEISTKC